MKYIMEIEIGLEAIVFYKSEKDELVATQMGELNERFGIELRKDEKTLEDYGFIGNYLGALEGTPFGVNYTLLNRHGDMNTFQEVVRSRVRFPTKGHYEAIEALKTKVEFSERHYETTIDNIDFNNPESIRILLEHPYVRTVAKIFGEEKSLDRLNDSRFVESLQKIEEEQ